MSISASVKVNGRFRSRPIVRPGRHWYRSIVVVLWVGMALVPALTGWSYYVLPLAERGYSPLHDFFKPSGAVGHTLGLTGSVMMIFGVGMYSLRKRFRPLRKWGKLSRWLEAHIFVCTLGPFLVMLHTSFKIGGIVSISFWSMAVVVASGVVGRYVYVRIPRTINGEFASMEMIDREKDALIQRLVRDSGVSDAAFRSLVAGLERPAPRGLLRSMSQSVRHDLSSRSRRRRILLALDSLPSAPEDPESMARQIEDHLKLSHQVGLMRSFRRLFGYWHVLHLPLAIVMFLIMFLHIAISALFGYAWVL